MDEEYLEGFRKIFSEYSDEDICSLLKEGDVAFDTDSWNLLLEEAEKRSITGDYSASPKRGSLKQRLQALLKIAENE